MKTHFEKEHVLEMKAHSETHFENENMFLEKQKVVNLFLQKKNAISNNISMFVGTKLDWLIISNHLLVSWADYHALCTLHFIS